MPLRLPCPDCPLSGSLGWPLMHWEACASPSALSSWLVGSREGPSETPQESSTMPFCTIILMMSLA